MGQAFATLGAERIEVSTKATNDFEVLLAACKRVPGGRWRKQDRVWHYPLSVDTCRALRRAFGDILLVSHDLAEWYRVRNAEAEAHTELSSASDATLPRLSTSHSEFVKWLRPAQRVGAAWVAHPYRNAGIVGDTPGVGKTTETLAGLVEGGITGPVLVICPKASVRSVWGKELREHLPEVPSYLCYGDRARRQRELKRLANDAAKGSQVLRIVVIVAEMLRVVMGDPCWTLQEVIGENGIRADYVPKNKISGMCPQRLKSMTMECTLHVQVPVEKEKDKVPVDFSYPALFDRDLLGGGWSTVIIDESHKLLGSLTVVKGNLMGRGLHYLPERTGRRYALSGTPFGKAGRVEGLFGTLHWLWPDEYTSFWRWANEKFVVEKEIVNRRGLEVTKIRGLKGLRADASADEESAAWENFLRELGPRILRRTKEEALEGLPPKTYAESTCTMTTKQARQYRDLLLDAEVRTPGGPVMANGSLALLMRSRQIANGQITRDDSGQVHFTGQESGKIDQLWTALDERGMLAGLAGTKLVIASAFNEFLDALYRRLLQETDWKCLRYDGRMSQNSRDNTIDEWQDNYIARDGERVLLLNAKAGGLSITLDAADEMHIMDEDPDPGVNEQLEDRIHRASRKHHVLITYYRTEGTIDYKRAHDVEFRRRVQHALLDGRRGVPDTRAALIEAFESHEEQ